MSLTNQEKECYIIQKAGLIHCQRGIGACKKCRAMNIEKYCLLNLCPKGEYAKPVMSIKINGKTQFREYDIEKIFDRYSEAFEYSQNSKIPLVRDSKPVEDKLLEKLKVSLPDNWKMEIIDDILTLRRNEPVFQLFENQINAPVNKETESQRAERIKKFGKPINLKLQYFLETKWMAERYDKIRADNAILFDQMTGLEKKYRLKRIDKPRKSGLMFSLLSEQDEENFALYQKEKEQLEKKVKPVPDYNSESYSIFIEDEIGINDGYSLIWPEIAHEEIFIIKDLVSKILSK